METSSQYLLHMSVQRILGCTCKYLEMNTVRECNDVCIELKIILYETIGSPCLTLIID